MNKQSYPLGSPKAFGAYPKADFDIESGNSRKGRRQKGSVLTMPGSLLRNIISYFYKFHPLVIFLISLSLGVTVFLLISVSDNHFKLMSSLKNYNLPPISYPLSNLQNLVMVAGHSVYTSNNCGKVDSEGSWSLQSYQKHPGQAATFVAHIKEGIEIAAKDDDALLLFSGGETRKDAGPRSEAQSYWSIAESKEWFGKGNSIRNRALTEEHARDSFENLLFSVCRFRELTGSYPHNITVVGYDFKKERFTRFHRSAIGFPEDRFFYFGTPTSSSSIEAALKGEAAVRAQFQEDPYGCSSSLYRKKLGRDPFHRSIPYPNGCPELKGLFEYCGSGLYSGSLPWIA